MNHYPLSHASTACTPVSARMGLTARAARPAITVTIAVLISLFLTPPSIADTFAGREAPVRNYQPWTETGCAPPLTLAPDGKLWPTQARQLQQKEKKKGRSSLLLDNSKNQQDMYVKVSRTADRDAKNFARAAFIPAGQQLKLLDMAAGEYVVKLMDIKSGCAQVSKPLRLKERRTEKEIEYVNASLTFYGVVDGNTELNKLNAASF